MQIIDLPFICQEVYVTSIKVVSWKVLLLWG